MGIRKYSDTNYRVTITDRNGEALQTYFKTLEEAEQYQYNVKVDRGSYYNGKHKKRSDSKYPDLPVGIDQLNVKKNGANNKRYNYKVIRANICFHGKLQYKSLSFGENRTREEAIRICKEWRNDKLKQLERESKIKPL